MSDWNKQIIEEFRANEGKVGGHFANNTLLLLHTTGAKSGKERVNPLATFEDDGRLVIIGVIGGAVAELNLAHMMVKRQRIIGSVIRSRPVEERAYPPHREDVRRRSYRG